MIHLTLRTIVASSNEFYIRKGVKKRAAYGACVFLDNLTEANSEGI